MPTTGAHELSAAHRLFEDNPPSTLIIAAHPDDEVIGAAGALLHLRDRATVLHVTDGAPRNLQDAMRAGFDNATAYAHARHAESRAALAFAAGAKLLDGTGIEDQGAAYCLPRLTQALIQIVKELRPEVILTHAFEGGHPDHDAVAFAAANTARVCAVPLLEMSGYFDDGSPRMATNRFAQMQPPACIHVLSRMERWAKRRMLNCFETQAPTLEAFGTDSEPYRTAPAYNFAEAPNGGRVLYDRFDWGLRSCDWPELARTAQRQLDSMLAAP